MRVTRWLEEFRHDVKFALRQMKSSPAFAAVAAMSPSMTWVFSGTTSSAPFSVFAIASATWMGSIRSACEKYPSVRTTAASPSGSACAVVSFSSAALTARAASGLR